MIAKKRILKDVNMLFDNYTGMILGREWGMCNVYSLNLAKLW
jgi:hypothetical protein